MLQARPISLAAGGVIWISNERFYSSLLELNGKNRGGRPRRFCSHKAGGRIVFGRHTEAHRSNVFEVKNRAGFGIKNQGRSKVAELKSKFTESPGAQRAGLPDLDSTNSEIVSDNTKSKGALEFAHKLESLKVPSLAKRADMLPVGVKQQAQVAGKKLALELPKMITRAQGDPDKLMASVQETLPTTNFAILGSLPDGDIEALSFLVLMEASKSAQEDLKAIMAPVKSINQAKDQLRTVLGQLGSHSGRAKKKDDDD